MDCTATENENGNEISENQENGCEEKTCDETHKLRNEVKELRDMLEEQNKHLMKLISISRGSQSTEDDDEKCKVQIHNPNLANLEFDVLYHLSIDTKNYNFRKLFGDVKFVCMGGSPERMEKFAYFIMKEVGLRLHAGAALKNISAAENRFAMYKIGPVISVSHGMGTPSISILLHEMIKLVYYAKCQDPVFIRIGTCGGVGVEGGTVCITEEALDGQLRNAYEVIIQGEPVLRPTKLDSELAQELKSLSDSSGEYKTVIGKTMCAHDFYEGQARMDGAFCEFTLESKKEYLQKLMEEGVINIEMESTVFAASTSYAGIRAACICVALLNRLEGDQISTPKEQLSAWAERPQSIVARYIRKCLEKQNEM